MTPNARTPRSRDRVGVSAGQDPEEDGASGHRIGCLHVVDVTVAQFFGLAVTSDAAAGLANQLFKFAHDSLADLR